LCVGGEGGVPGGGGVIRCVGRVEEASGCGVGLSCGWDVGLDDREEGCEGVCCLRRSLLRRG
jgi:hypothetical protein